MKAFEFSLILPCWNEKGALPYLFDQYGPLVLERSVEVIFVDNGSTDGTADEYKRLLALNPAYANGFRYLRVDRNKGVGGGLKAGACVASGRNLVFCHADEQYGRDTVVAAIERYGVLCAKGDGLLHAVKGVRRARKPKEIFISRGFDLVASTLSHAWLHDINAQPKVFPKPASNSFWDSAPDDYCIDLFVILAHKRLGFRWWSVEVVTRERLSGSSSWSRSWPSVLKLSRRYVAYLRSPERP